MLIPLIWLEDFVKVRETPEKIGEKLLLSGTKVEEIRKEKAQFVFNLEITPNRTDELSVLGVAREVASLFAKEIKIPNADFFVSPVASKDKINLKIKDKKLCPFYSVVKLNNLEIKASSSWLQEYLLLAGIRPINNVVDITNFVMLELGQPMHAFDFQKIKGTLTVRSTKENEIIKTLDGVERTLNQGAIVIEDSEKIIDLCGLMGGGNSGIDEHTTEILLLVPVYDPVAIRKTSLFTNLRTEASNRFEKKLDPNLHPYALNRAISLLIEEAGASLASGVNNFNYPQEEKSFNFPLKLIKNILGIDLSIEQIINQLSPLGFQIRSSNLDKESLLITIPSFRGDIAIPEDILEEIGRTFGYNNFPKTLPNGEIPVQDEIFSFDNERLLRKNLLTAGYTETCGYTLVSEEDLLKVSFDNKRAIKVLHSTSSDFLYLRPTLLINALKVVATNQREEEISFFETAKEFTGPLEKNNVLPQQEVTTFLITNKPYPKLKGVVDYLLKKYSLELEIKPNAFDPIFEKGAVFLSRKTVVAKAGQIKTKLSKNFGIGQTIFGAWLNSEFLGKTALAVHYYSKPKFPPVIEDISVFVEKETPALEIINEIKRISTLIFSAEVTDIFEKKGRKSITLRINYLNQHKTMTGKEVALIRRKVEKMLKTKFKGEIR